MIQTFEDFKAAVYDATEPFLVDGQVVKIERVFIHEEGNRILFLLSGLYGSGYTWGVYDAIAGRVVSFVSSGLQSALKDISFIPGEWMEGFSFMQNRAALKMEIPYVEEYILTCQTPNGYMQFLKGCRSKCKEKNVWDFFTYLIGDGKEYQCTTLQKEKSEEIPKQTREEKVENRDNNSLESSDSRTSYKIAIISIIAGICGFLTAVMYIKM